MVLNKTNRNGKIGLDVSVFTLQIIAMLSMLSDHLGYSIFGNPLWMRCAGRFAFPIYAFLLAEGYRHIKNDTERLLKHLGGLVVLAVISEIPYDLMEGEAYTVKEIFSSQSAMITLLIGFLGLMAIDAWKQKPLFLWAAVILTALANYFTSANYKLVGVLLVYAFYYYLEKGIEKKSFIIKYLSLLLIFALYLPIYHIAKNNFEIIMPSYKSWCWYATHILIAALLALYNGRLGYYNKKFKAVYKSFYPAHMLVIGILKFFA